MGYFSWKTQDTDKSIANHSSNRNIFTVHMLDDKGNIWTEDNYEGYGEFGGKDFYELLAEMNGLDSDRQLGIKLAFGDEPYISPNLIEKIQGWKYTSDEPENCEYQGYFYEEDYDDEDYDDV